MKTRLKLFDTTLRDGMQSEGMSLSVEERLRIIHKLDELGIHFIEAGFPGSNPREHELFQRLESERFANAEICAFGMTRRRHVKAEDDDILRTLAECPAPVCVLVGKTWGLHLEKVTKVDAEKNLRIISESVDFLARQEKRVIYDAEHFFDAYRDGPDYALRCVRAALEAGAENVTLCDTNGSTLPSEIAEATAKVVTEFDGSAIGIHAHNDAACGVANSLAAVERGAVLVQGTINGYGERCGNADLVSIIPALQLKMGYRCLRPKQLAKLTETAHFVDEMCNLTPRPNQPYVGKNAFAHKGGLHVAGVVRDARTFEHVDPEAVGNEREVLVSELSGKGTLQSRARDVGIGLDDAHARRLLARLKALEHRGYHYEAADASFELLLRKETESYEPLFRLESFRVITDKLAGGKVQTEATIKIWINGERVVRTAEGNGPVNALDKALRDAIVDKHPHLRDIDLVNYKVRILDETKGTGAVTRVLLDSSDGQDTWGAIGVSENIIEASWEALVDSLEHPVQSRRKRSTSSRSRKRSVDSRARSRKQSAGDSSRPRKQRGDGRLGPRNAPRGGNAGDWG